MKMHTLQDLLVNHLRDLYHAENQIIKALPKMAKAANSSELASGFEKHLEETRRHAERLEEVFELLDVPPKGKRCQAIEGLIEEGKELMEEDAAAAVLDAGLIAAAQKVEHYEIAAYGCARTWAEQLGLRQAVNLLQKTLDEEKATDEKLTMLAEQMVNLEAEVGDQGEDATGRGNGARKSAQRARATSGGRSRR